ncbi:hypothetical protein Tco_0591875 [Tanacetum coccineum]
MRGAVAETTWFFTSGRNLLKQCPYSISEADSPSTYMRCTKWPPISASMIIGPSVPSSSPKGGNEISRSKEKLCTLNELGVSDSVHESGDSHALWGSLNMPTLSFKSLHEIFRGFPFFLFDVVNFYRIFDTLLLLKEVR